MRRIAMSVSVDGAVLAGEVLYPATEALGSVLLLSGSGPQDRFQTLGGVGTFQRLAEAIRSEGYIVTIWDDRGVGDSTGDYLDADEGDLAADVCAVARWLTAATGQVEHVLVGHSQGTLVAMLAAIASPETFRGVLLLAPPGRPGRDVLLWQHRRLLLAAGASEDEADFSCARQERLFDILLEWDEGSDGFADRDRIAQRLRRVLAEGIEGEPDEPTRAAIDDAVEDLMEWEWRFLLRSKPADLLAQLRCRVAVIVGDRDDHVDCSADIEALRASGKAFALNVVSDHDHLFCHIQPDDGLASKSEPRPFSDIALSSVRKMLREICHHGPVKSTRHGKSEGAE